MDAEALRTKLAMTHTKVDFLSLFEEIEEMLSPEVSIWIKSLQDPSKPYYKPGGILHPQYTTEHNVKDLLNERGQEFTPFDVEVLLLLRSCCLKDQTSLNVDEEKSFAIRRQMLQTRSEI